jgi:hypothetical protein
LGHLVQRNELVLFIGDPKGDSIGAGGLSKARLTELWLIAVEGERMTGRYLAYALQIISTELDLVVREFLIVTNTHVNEPVCLWLSYPQRLYIKHVFKGEANSCGWKVLL